MDLDTALNKIDSRLINDVLVIKGPYSVWYGPGLHFVDVDLLKAPRYPDGHEIHGSTGIDFKTNGDQWYGRTAVWGGGPQAGYQVSYGHAMGNDYVDGAGQGIASSYKSRDFNVALGLDPCPHRSLDFHFLRLDQSDVEYPGMVFDMDFLVTEAYELAYVLEDQRWCDRLQVEGWYNHTQFFGDAQSPAKRLQHPVLDFIRYRGHTAVDSTSTGYRTAMTWGEDAGPSLTLGTDYRYVRQELDEIASGRVGFQIFDDANSPIPKSRWANPGVFVERRIPVGERTTLKGGARVDFVSTNVIDDPTHLEKLGLQPPDDQSSLVEILGDEKLDRSFTLWAAHLSAEYELSPDWRVVLAGGHGERAPSLTELYAAEPFLLLLQNGLNTVAGDPELAPEKVWQVDAGLRCEKEKFRCRIGGFYAWYEDYITFETMRTWHGPPSGGVEQVNYKFVNTQRATISGWEARGEVDATPWLTPFAALTYTEGTDHTRDGAFATRRAEPGLPSSQIPGLPRGFFSGIPGNSTEPLPGIYPLDGRLGFRLHEPAPQPRWAIELAARIVADQDRVARSLLESPTAGFTVWDFRSYWRPGDRWLLVAGVENFADVRYQEHLDHRSPSGLSVFQPGVNFYFGTQATF